jgi:hypothetical protein
MILAAVSRDGDHGYVFVQEKEGPCIACMFPDMADYDRYPCPGTPAIADILQTVGSMAVYAADTLLMKRPRTWNYRRVSLSDDGLDGASLIPAREGCSMPAPDCTEYWLDPNYKGELKMAKWKKNESLGRALAREGKSIAKGVGKELLSIATLGFYKPKRRYRRDGYRGRWW